MVWQEGAIPTSSDRHAKELVSEAVTFPINSYSLWHPPTYLHWCQQQPSTKGTGKRRAGVISEPEVCIVDLQHNDHFLIMASDGVWEFMDNQEAVDIVSICSDDETACSKVCCLVVRVLV